MWPDLESHSNAFAAAVAWLQGTLLGTIATTGAVIAVAWVGFLMLTGRVDVRRAVQAVLGCFIIFGASTIANGIFGAAPGIGTNSDLAQAPSPPPTLPTPPAYPNVLAAKLGTAPAGGLQ